MAVSTNDKKLDGKGLGVVWGLVKTLYNNLAAVVETNRVKYLDGVESLSLSGTFAKNSLINCAQVIYVANAQVTGLPTNIVTEDGVMVTDDNEVVVDGSNTESKWQYVCGQTIDRTPQSNSDSVVRSIGIYNDLTNKADKKDLENYVNDCGYNSRTKSIELKHDGKVICAIGAAELISDALKPLVDRLDLIESRYVYETD